MGMTASVRVIAGEAQDAVLVPVSALHQQADGSYTVNVQQNGKFVAVPVQVGLKDLVNAQIISGVQQGDVVSTASSGSVAP
jgi:macrolide-specific efflux system membrane fusion protein